MLAFLCGLRRDGRTHGACQLAPANPAGPLAVIATMVTGNPVYDAIGTLVIGGLRVVTAVFVAVEVKALLIGQSVEPAVPSIPFGMNRLFDRDYQLIPAPTPTLLSPLENAPLIETVAWLLLNACW